MSDDSCRDELAAALARGDWPVALAALERRERASAPNASIPYNRGLVLRRLDRTADALDAFRASLRIDPDHAHARFELASALMEAGELAAAADGFARYLGRVPDDAHAHLNLGRLLVRLGRPAEAPAHLERAGAALGPEAVAEALATARRDVGDLDGCRAALATLPDSPQGAALRLKVLVQGPTGRVRLRAGGAADDAGPGARQPRGAR